MDGLQTSGRLSLFGAPVAADYDAKRFALLPQSWDLAFIGHTVGTDLELLSLNFDVTVVAFEEAIRRFLRVRDIRRRHSSSLSRGERQVVAIAALSVLRPRACYLDEPDAFLDDENFSKVLDWLSELIQGGAKIAIATHRPELYESLSPEFIRIKSLVSHEEWPGPKEKGQEGPRGNVHLEISRQELKLPNGLHLSMGNFSIQGSKLTVLFGLNGSGKTTLLRWLRRQRTRGDGFFKESVMVSEEPNDQLVFRTVGEELSLVGAGAKPAHGWASIEVFRRLGGANTLISQLSWGQRRILTILCAVLAMPGLLLIDEPEAGLDPVSTKLVYGMIDEALMLGSAVVVALNRRSHLWQRADSRLYVSQDGGEITVTVARK